METLDKIVPGFYCCKEFGNQSTNQPKGKLQQGYETGFSL